MSEAKPTIDLDRLADLAQEMARHLTVRAHADRLIAVLDHHHDRMPDGLRQRYLTTILELLAPHSVQKGLPGPHRPV